MFTDRTPHDGTYRALRAAYIAAGLAVPTLAVQMGEVAGRLEFTRIELTLVVAGLLTGALLGTLARELPCLRARSRLTVAASAWSGAAFVVALPYAPGTVWAGTLTQLIGGAASITYVMLARHERYHIVLWNHRRHLAVGALVAAVATGAAAGVSGSAELMAAGLALGSGVLFTYAAGTLNGVPAAVRQDGRWKRVALLCALTLPLAAVLYGAGSLLRADLAMHPNWGLCVAVLVLAFPPRFPVTTAERHGQSGVGFAAISLVAMLSVAALILEDVTSRPVVGVLMWIATLVVAFLALMPAREVVVDELRTFAGVTSWLVLAGCVGYTTGPAGFGIPAPGDGLQHAVLFGAALIVAGAAWIVAAVRTRRDRDATE